MWQKAGHNNLQKASDKNRYDLTEGSILKKLLLVALPIVGSQFIQMTYNLTDMFWLGKLSSDAVAAAGTAGLFLWLTHAFMLLSSMGAEIGVSQSIGRGEREEARKYTQNALFIALFTGVILGGGVVLFRRPLIGFFNIKEVNVASDAADYLGIIGAGIPLTFISASITGTFNASGTSRVPFFINAIGLITNVVLDPIFIFTLGKGVTGAALATVSSQVIVCLFSILALLLYKNRPFEKIKLICLPERKIVAQILKWCVPISLESLMFSSLTMIISRFVSDWGASAIAVQRLGGQIESLSWLLGAALGSAFVAFTGQNYGASKWNRIREGFRLTSLFGIFWGIVISCLMFFFGGTLYSLFVKESDVIIIGAAYLRILAMCQITGNLESISSGAFKGLGKTLPPTIISGFCNAFRVPLCYFLAKTSLGLDGIWIGVTIGAVMRGFGMFIWYNLFSRSLPKKDLEEGNIFEINVKKQDPSVES